MSYPPLEGSMENKSKSVGTIKMSTRLATLPAVVGISGNWSSIPLFSHSAQLPNCWCSAASSEVFT